MTYHSATDSPMNGGIQLALDLRPRAPHGGARKGAGRKRRSDRVGFASHRSRAKYDGKHPVHVTVRAVKLPSLRSHVIFTALKAIFAKASEKAFRLLHYSVQWNHLHLVAEADDGEALARGIQRLLSRAAFAINKLTGHTGKVWRDRYHRHDLTTPTAVRHAYVYVLFNVRKHTAIGSDMMQLLDCLDPCSSAAWFDRAGWKEGRAPSDDDLRAAGPSIVAQPTTWLARVGWKKSRFGLLSSAEMPVVGH